MLLSYPAATLPSIVMHLCFGGLELCHQVSSTRTEDNYTYNSCRRKNNSSNHNVQKHLDSSRNSIESCTSQLLSWRPFHRSKTLDSSNQPPQSPSTTNGFHSTPKRPCFSDRSTSFAIEAMSRLSLTNDDNGGKTLSASNRGSFRLVARKRRRRNSRSVSGKSSDRSVTRRCCSIGTHGTCSDLPFAVGTDSSGELFGEMNWASDVSEAARNSRRDRRDSGGEKEVNGGFGFAISEIDPIENEPGYGSEPGYRGDAELGYDDEFDDEEEDVKPLFWGDTDSRMEMSGETKFSDSKPQFRCRRRRQHDYKTVDSMRRNTISSSKSQVGVLFNVFKGQMR